MITFNIPLRIVNDLVMMVLIAFMTINMSYASPRSIIVLGDSLSAEYGLAKDTGWVFLMQQRLTTLSPDYKVINASISGDTTAGGRSRLNKLLTRYQPHIIILELGANDALQGIDLKNTRDNLTQMISASQAAGAQVIVVGIQVPSNFGMAFNSRLEKMYAELVPQERLIPFMLSGFENDLSYFQADGIHPNEKAQALILDHIWPRVTPLLK